jgi:heme-degrading monooxygenase HmoA
MTGRDDRPPTDAGGDDPEGGDQGPVITVFRSRLRAGAEAAYGPLAARMEELARTQPGFVEVKNFEAADGERVSLVRFADRATHDAWRRHPEHRAAQRQGRRELYAEFSILVCRPVAERSYEGNV